MSAVDLAKKLVETLNNEFSATQGEPDENQCEAVVKASFQGKEFAHVKIIAKGPENPITKKPQAINQPENMEIYVHAIGTGGYVTLPTRQFGFFMHALIQTRATWRLFLVPSLPSSSHDQLVLNYRAGIGFVP